MELELSEVAVLHSKSRAFGQDFYAQGVFLPTSQVEIYEERDDKSSEREIVLSTFQETSWGGCACRNS